MSIPNIITLARLLCVPLMVWLIVSDQLYWGFWLFMAAGLSDAVDGFIARVFRSRTLLGGYLDPLADKALLVCVYVALAHTDHIPLWLVILVVFRDALIVGGVLLLYTMRESFSMQPLVISKLNTVMQIALAAWILAVQGLNLPNYNITQILIYVVAATTFLSGANYVLLGSRITNRHGSPR